ncbi:MAG: hypothetical protein K0Q49_1035 [Haloplasmataceae bacterium]|jgi:hypothetical protein|nr:hypothetical protein [Haloplasmataceae bacterium]
MKKMIISLIILLTVIVVLNVKANTSSRDINEFLSNTSSTLLDSNLFTHVDDQTIFTQGDVDMNHYVKAIENDHLILYVDDEAFAIRIENRATGYIWSSEPIDSELSRSFKERSRSAFTLSLIDDRNRPFDEKNLFDVKKLKKDYLADDEFDIVTFNVDMEDYEIRLTYSIKLNESSIEFNLNRDDIEEYGENRLLWISFYEFLGAAHTNKIPGYNFIPSGNGALVRYGENSNIKDPYRARFYNQDLYYSLAENNLGLNYPVYGSVHGINQNGFLVNVTSGSEFAQFTYYPTGEGTKYHWQTTTFYLRENYMQSIKGSKDGVKIIEQDLKDIDIKFNITFLSNEDANYVGMAKKYKSYLVENNILEKNNQSELELHLDVLGSDFEEGIFFNKTHKMTTVKDIFDINEELTSNNVNNIFYTLRGFNNGGNTKSSYNNYTFDKALGNYRDLEELNVAYYYNPVVRYQSKLGAPKNTLETITKTFAGVQIMNGDYMMYYTDIEKVVEEFPKAYDEIQKYGGMALDGLSNNFYSNKNNRRNEMFERYDNLFDEQIPMYNPNSIMLSKTAKFLTMPLEHERLRFFSDSVPFLQIVLSGYVPYYSTYLNFSANMNIDILKVIDYGANPAFLITKLPSHLLMNTLSREYYGSYYGNLNHFIIDHYQYINHALNKVVGAEIVSRDVIKEGIVVTQYENDYEIIVNYSNEDYDYNGNIVNKLNYLVLGS